MSARPRPSKLTLWPLVAATYFMVAGGPYGLEELIAAAGWKRAILILLVNLPAATGARIGNEAGSWTDIASAIRGASPRRW